MNSWPFLSRGKVSNSDWFIDPDSALAKSGTLVSSV